MKYAIISSGNKQYKVSEGDIIEVDRLPVKAEELYVFSNVLLYVDGTTTKIGTPVLSEIIVTGAVVENKKGQKIRVSKFKAKSRYRNVRGFRPYLTSLKIGSITLKGEKVQAEAPKKLPVVKTAVSKK